MKSADNRRPDNRKPGNSNSVRRDPSVSPLRASDGCIRDIDARIGNGLCECSARRARKKLAVEREIEIQFCRTATDFEISPELMSDDSSQFLRACSIASITSHVLIYLFFLFYNIEFNSKF